MTTRMIATGSCFGALVVVMTLPPAIAAEQKAHQHGQASLRVTVDGQSLQLALESPLENFIGFERAPRTEKERTAVKAMAERFARPDALFVLTPAARCVVGTSRIDAPVAGLGSKSVADAQSTAAGKVVSGGAKKGAKADHADLEAQFVFQCEDVAKLQGVEVRLFDAFNGLRQLDVQAVTPLGQKSLRLTPSKRQVTW